MKRFKIILENINGDDDGFLLLAKNRDEANEVAKKNLATIIQNTGDKTYACSVVEFKDGEGPSELSSQFMQSDEIE
ncbi:MAG: hypothetical protein WC554_15005 [Clostridia bacterium]